MITTFTQSLNELHMFEESSGRWHFNIQIGSMTVFHGLMDGQ